MAHCCAGALQPALDTNTEDENTDREDDKDVGDNEGAEVDGSN